MDIALVGLGNPGSKYQDNRHNIGRNFLNSYARAYQLSYSKKFLGLYALQRLDDIKCHILLPETFMNLSGNAVCELVNFFKVDLNNLLVIHDEVDFAFARMSFKKGGGTAGHNGLNSIVDRLGEDFIRLRLGVGKGNFDTADWVLSDFTTEEEKNVFKLFESSKDILDSFIREGWEGAASNYNNKTFEEV